MSKVKIISPIIIAISIMFLACFAFAGCSDDAKENDLVASANVYFDGTQTISITFSELSDNVSTFVDTISKSDVTVLELLKGKTVESVKYVSGEQIDLTLSGIVKASEPQDSESVFGKIVISGKAFKNGTKGLAYVGVNYHPKMVCTTSMSTTTADGKKNCVSEFELPYGEFIASNANTTNITVPVGDVEIEVSVTLSGKLKITVKNFEPFTYGEVKYDYPVAKIEANVTTFNKVLYVTIGNIYSVYATYDLV